MGEPEDADPAQIRRVSGVCRVVESVIYLDCTWTASEGTRHRIASAT
jgi:hypothetical protein